MTSPFVTDTRAYLDYNATAPLRPCARQAMLDVLGRAGNPSSIHAEGRAARAAVEAAREQVAALVGARPADVVFTSGGTEGANTVLTPALHRGEASPDRLLLLATEHACVRDGHRFAPEAAEHVPVDRDGVADIDHLLHRVGELSRNGQRVLASIHLANNETGVVQPVARAAEGVRSAGGFVHTDAVQAAGKLPVAIGDLGADVLTLSAHKIGGPAGIGAIVLANPEIALDPLLRGGGQERMRRAGTENVAGIAGFGAAAVAAAADLASETGRLGRLRDRLEAGVRAAAPAAVVFGEAVARLPNTSAFAVPGVAAQTLLMKLDMSGIAVSSGSACSSGKVRRSHVLEAMGVPETLATGALRVSLGWASTDADVDMFLAAFAGAIEVLHKRMRGLAAA